MLAENDNMKKAIQVAEQEYNSLLDSLKEYERIKLRLSQLEVFINTGKTLLGPDVTKSKNETAITRTLFPDENIQSSNNAEHIKRILTEVGRALSLSELVEEYDKRKFKLSENNGKEVLRGVIGRHKNIFKQEIIKNKMYVSLTG